ncbi:AAA family ATPase [Halosquirtibacter laminarini]|uniref:AAA family ATPase n=1 Tax=Halosquirtibacter laminarini TaxID=3374600 RepID=A0AC61NMM8_9BACT|nr:AAA family ATPase [Prolixibacteraceae bacterium]
MREMLSGISMENFRNFRENTSVDFNPITILTGVNSCGKSSLLKALMLLEDSFQNDGLHSLNFNGKKHHLGSMEAIHSKGSENEVAFTLHYKGITLPMFGMEDANLYVKLYFNAFNKLVGLQFLKEEIALDPFKKLTSDEEVPEACIYSFGFDRKYFENKSDWGTFSTYDTPCYTYRYKNSFYQVWERYCIEHGIEKNLVFLHIALEDRDQFSYDECDTFLQRIFHAFYHKKVSENTPTSHVPEYLKDVPFLCSFKDTFFSSLTFTKENDPHEEIAKYFGEMPIHDIYNDSLVECANNYYEAENSLLQYVGMPSLLLCNVQRSNTRRLYHLESEGTDFNEDLLAYYNQQDSGHSSYFFDNIREVVENATPEVMIRGEDWSANKTRTKTSEEILQEKNNTLQKFMDAVGIDKTESDALYRKLWGKVNRIETDENIREKSENQLRKYIVHSKDANNFIDYWIRTLGIGLGLRIEQIEGYMHRVWVINFDGTETNIADTGFGYSQLIAILLKIATNCESRIADQLREMNNSLDKEDRKAWEESKAKQKEKEKGSFLDLPGVNDLYNPKSIRRAFYSVEKGAIVVYRVECKNLPSLPRLDSNAETQCIQFRCGKSEIQQNKFNILKEEIETIPIKQTKGEYQKLFLLEEPECNLHPKLQSLLADMLVDAVKRFDVQFVVETHSEYLIRKMQFLTAKGAISSDESVIYYLYPPNNIPEGKKHIERINITPKGTLDNQFGQGFFDESSNLMMGLLTGEVNK